MNLIHAALAVMVPSIIVLALVVDAAAAIGLDFEVVERRRHPNR
jgi:hypothetical protein